jgi:hypothetical protein
MNPKRKPRKRVSSGTPLRQHARRGSTLKPPLMALDNVQPIDWARDHLPDVLLVATVVKNLGDDALHPLMEAHRRIVEVLETENIDPTSPPRNGSLADLRLTSLEALPANSRQAALDSLRRDALLDSIVTPEFCNALRMYHSAPGTWVVEAVTSASTRIDPVLAERELSQIVEATRYGRGEVATLVKVFLFIAGVNVGKLQIPRDMFDPGVMSRYPHDVTPDERGMVESQMRAASLALVGAGQGNEDSHEAQRWARTFWRANWNLYSCRFRDESASPVERNEVRLQVDAFRAELDRIKARITQIAQRRTIDLYNPDRDEVLLGSASRAARLLEPAVYNPSAWSIEHGAFLVRASVETLIQTRWLIKQTDRNIFSEFKAYGRGRRKLRLKLIEEFVEAQEDPSPESIQYLETLRLHVNAEVDEEWQNIRTRTVRENRYSFNGQGCRYG